MRVVYITSTLPTGPGESFVYPEIEELLVRGHDVFIAPMKPAGSFFHKAGENLQERTLLEGLLSWRVLTGALAAVLGRPGRAFAAFVSLLTANPKHLLKNLAVLPKGLWLGRHALQWRADHLHAHWAATTASIAMVAGIYSGIPWSFTAHRWDILENNLLRRKILHARFGRFISRRGLETAEALGAVPPKGDVCVIYMGVPMPATARPRERRQGRFRILSPANLIPIKGHKYLLQAVAKLRHLPDLELWIAGDGELESALHEKTEELGITERVVFLGRLDHGEVLNLYRRQEVDAICLASLDLGFGLHEGIPVSLIEAMSFGVPAIATRSGGIPELLGGGAGLTVAPADADGLAEAIADLYRNDELYRELSREGMQKVRLHFSVTTSVDELEKRMANIGRPKR